MYEAEIYCYIKEHTAVAAITGPAYGAAFRSPRPILRPTSPTVFFLCSAYCNAPCSVTAEFQCVGMRKWVLPSLYNIHQQSSWIGESLTFYKDWLLVSASPDPSSNDEPRSKSLLAMLGALRGARDPSPPTRSTLCSPAPTSFPPPGPEIQFRSNHSIFLHHPVP